MSPVDLTKSLDSTSCLGLAESGGASTHSTHRDGKVERPLLPCIHQRHDHGRVLQDILLVVFLCDPSESHAHSCAAAHFELLSEPQEYVTNELTM
jgi:hypothetical protein